MKAQTKTALVDIVVSVLCIAAMIACGMFIYERTVIYYCSVATLALAVVVLNAVDAEAHPHVARTAMAAAVVLAVVIGCYIVYVSTGLSKTFNDFDALKTFILNSGFWGFAVFIALTIFQVVVLPIPQAFTILLGVAIYGATISFVLSVIGTIIGSLLSFLLGKVFGRKLCNWMFGADNTEKYAKLVGDKGRFLFIIMLLFPAFPDDMLCMIAGITTMSYTYFTIVCVLTRPVMIGVTAYLGSGMIPFSGWGIPVWIALACLMFVAFVLISAVKKRVESRERRLRR